MALKQDKIFDPSEKLDALTKAITDMVFDADVSWLTAMAACQQALCIVILNVDCAHCRRKFVEDGFVETMQPLLKEILRSVEEDEANGATQH